MLMDDAKIKILVITSCTGEKAFKPADQLTQDDFHKGRQHVAAREQELVKYLTPAESLYTGLQHVRLMRGVEAARKSEAVDLDLWILSAGYGLIPASQVIAPYECTFSGMKAKELSNWALHLGIPNAVEEVFANSYDLALVLLGDSYLKACSFNESLAVGGPTLFLAGKASAKRLPESELINTLVLGNDDTRKFACGLVGLKGEVVARVLEQLVAGTINIPQLMTNPEEVANGLGTNKSNESKSKKSKTKVNPKVDRIIEIPKTWWDKPHRAKLRYFIPEWDDLVDPDYDFENDDHSGGTGNWDNEVYAHQLYPEPNYDGILMSRAVAEKSVQKRERINRLGVHRYLRVPRAFPVMGDCGAFDYIGQDVPPYSTEDVLDYYTRLDFDFGVSVDHLIVGSTMHAKDFRYQLTIENAHKFLEEHKAQGLSWTPIGAVQGWDPKSYANAANDYVRMGYKYIALGGLVRSSTKEVLQILEEVKKKVPDDIDIHLFGLSRIQHMSQFAQMGVRSVDSASLLRRAWMGTGQNYLTLDGVFYAAIRIPQTGKSFRAKRIVSEGRATEKQLFKLEAACWKSIRALDKGAANVNDVVESLMALDHMITPDRPDTSEMLRQVLEERPWKKCPCAICQTDGIEVIVFRGNNRNRRRGFHNTFVFYKLLQRALAGESVRFISAGKLPDLQQMPLGLSAAGG